MSTASPVARQAPGGVHLLRWVCTKNPFYAISAALMLAGLWAQPVVATRLHREPPHATPEKKLARFVVECRVKFLAEWRAPLVRWAPGQTWSRQGNGEGRLAPVAEPLSCRILERKRTS